MSLARGEGLLQGGLLLLEEGLLLFGLLLLRLMDERMERRSVKM